MKMSGQTHAPVALPPGKSLQYPLDRRLGGPQSRFGRGGEEKNSLPPLPGFQPRSSIPQPRPYTDLATPASQTSGDIRLLSNL